MNQFEKKKLFYKMFQELGLVGCKIKANCPLMGPGPTGRMTTL